MATIRKISTSEILELLRTNSDHTKFFYLYVSTSGRVDKRKQSKPLPPGQQTLDKHFQQQQQQQQEGEEEEEEEEEEDGDSESDVEPMDTSQQMPPSPVQENPVAQNSPVLPSTPPAKKTRENAMGDVHKKILPELLYPHGWQKVYDNDLKITYRALYFNTIEKLPSEDDITHIQRVDKYREMIRDKVEKLKEERGANFKIDSLLSRPLLYDPPTLQEQSTREKSTQRKQTQIDAHFPKKTI